MKNLTLILILLSLLGCEGTLGYVDLDVVCQVGKNPGQDWELIRCTDNKGYIAGNNVAEGGTKLIDQYDQIARTDTYECSKCKEMYP